MIFVGTIVDTSGNCRNFEFDQEAEKLVLDGFYRLYPETKEEDSAIVAAQITHLIRYPVSEIRIGSYFCGICKTWCKANPAEWSVGICLSCSLDRDSDFRDSLD